MALVPEGRLTIVCPYSPNVVGRGDDDGTPREGQPPMTPAPRLGSLTRSLLFLASGLVVTGAAAGHVMQAPGVYSSQVDAVFLLPLSQENPNSLQFRSESLISFAGVIQRTVSATQSGIAPTSDAVTLVGQGVRHGYSVRLPNSGGQWASNFDRPLLDVQAAGSSPAEVRTTMRQVLQAIGTDLISRQRAAGVSAKHMVSMRESPDRIPMYYSRGSHLRAVAATLALGSTLSVIGAGLMSKRPRRTQQRGQGIARLVPSAGRHTLRPVTART